MLVDLKILKLYICINIADRRIKDACVKLFLEGEMYNV